MATIPTLPIPLVRLALRSYPASRAKRSATSPGRRDAQVRGKDADDARTRALDALRATIVAHDTDEGVLYPSATWIIGARRA